MLKMIAVSLAFAAAAAAPLSAQGKGQKAHDIPPGMRPPAGMCRIWLDGVPPGQQPAPTDCATAVRNRPSNGRVIFGNDYADGKGRKVKGDEKRRSAPREERERDDDSDDKRNTVRHEDRNDDDKRSTVRHEDRDDDDQGKASSGDEREREDGERPSTSNDRHSRHREVERTKARARRSVPDSARAERKPE